MCKPLAAQGCALSVMTSCLLNAADFAAFHCARTRFVSQNSRRTRKNMPGVCAPRHPCLCAMKDLPEKDARAALAAAPHPTMLC